MIIKLQTEVKIKSENDLLTFKHNDNFYSLKGKGLYPLILAIFTEISHPVKLQAVLDKFHQKNRKMVENIIHNLVDKGFILSVDKIKSHTLSEEELEKYQNEISYIRTFNLSAESIFENVIHKKIKIYVSEKDVKIMVKLKELLLLVGFKYVVIIKSQQYENLFFGINVENEDGIGKEEVYWLGTNSIGYKLESICDLCIAKLPTIKQEIEMEFLLSFLCFKFFEDQIGLENKSNIFYYFEKGDFKSITAICNCKEHIERG